MFRGISMKAVLIGVVLDWAASVFLGAGLATWVIVGVVLQHPGQPPDMPAIDHAIKTPLICLILCGAGGVISLIPGFATGWLARTQRIKNALVMSVVSAASSCVILPLTHGYPAWYFPICTLASIVGCGMGGFFSDLAFGRNRVAQGI
jgi:hypothetical protein